MSSDLKSSCDAVDGDSISILFKLARDLAFLPVVKGMSWRNKWTLAALPTKWTSERGKFDENGGRTTTDVKVGLMLVVL